MITTSERDLARYMGGLDHAKPRKRGTGLHGSPRRVDKNQRQIVAELRQAGCSVTDTHTLGSGFVDIVASHPQAKPPSQNWLFEIKSDGGRLTDDEIEWHREWPGQKAVIYCFEDAARIMGLI
jgi:hypothetical protein